MKKTLVIGIGSILRGDDGAGISVIDALERETLPQNVSLKKGDLSGLDLLKYFPQFKRVIIIDAVDMKANPGTTKVFSSNKIKNSQFSGIVSSHGFTLHETLTLAGKLGISSEIIVVGIQPKDTSFRLGCSDIIEKRLPAVVIRVKKLLKQESSEKA